MSVDFGWPPLLPYRRDDQGGIGWDDVGDHMPPAEPDEQTAYDQNDEDEYR